MLDGQLRLAASITFLLISGYQSSQFAAESLAMMRLGTLVIQKYK